MSDLELPKSVLGRTGLSVATLGYGAMEVRGSRIWGGRPIEDAEAEQILNAVVDNGINFIDTANDYGRSEEYIGRFLSRRRDEFVLATKCGCTVVRRDENTDDTPHVWTRENLFRGLHESLERMRTDYVDLMQLHNPSVEQCENGDLVAALQEMKEQGKVRWIGVSSTHPHLETYIGWGVFDAFQIPYSALERQHEEVIQTASDSGAGVIVRGGVARGEPGAGLGEQDRWDGWEAARLDDLLDDGETRTGFLLRVYQRPPGHEHQHRRHHERSSFAGQHRGRGATVAGRYLRRGQTTLGRRIERRVKIGWPRSASPASGDAAPARNS